MESAARQLILPAGGTTQAERRRIACPVSRTVAGGHRWPIPGVRQAIRAANIAQPLARVALRNSFAILCGRQLRRLYSLKAISFGPQPPWSYALGLISTNLRTGFPIVVEKSSGATVPPSAEYTVRIGRNLSNMLCPDLR